MLGKLTKNHLTQTPGPVDCSLPGQWLTLLEWPTAMDPTSHASWPAIVKVIVEITSSGQILVCLGFLAQQRNILMAYTPYVYIYNIYLTYVHMMCIYIYVLCISWSILMIRTYYLSFFYVLVTMWGLPSARLMPMESKATGGRLHAWMCLVSFCSGKNVVLAYYVSMVTVMVTVMTVVVNLAEKKTAGEFSWMNVENGSEKHRFIDV